jgi:hypothetical protein
MSWKSTPGKSNTSLFERRLYLRADGWSIERSARWIPLATRDAGAVAISYFEGATPGRWVMLKIVTSDEVA